MCNWLIASFLLLLLQEPSVSNRPRAALLLSLAVQHPAVVQQSSSKPGMVVFIFIFIFIFVSLIGGHVAAAALITALGGADQEEDFNVPS